MLSLEPRSVFVSVAFAVFPLSAIASGFAIARARFRYNDKEIQCRFFRSIKRRWSDVDGWSLLDDRKTLFIRFSDGTIIGSDGWALTGSQIADLLPVLRDKVGDPQTGKNVIMPRHLQFLLGFMSEPE